MRRDRAAQAVNGAVTKLRELKARGFGMLFQPLAQMEALARYTASQLLTFLISEHLRWRNG